MLFQDGDVKVEFKDNNWLGYYKNNLVTQIVEKEWANEFVAFDSREAATVVAAGINDLAREGIFKTAADPMPMGDASPPPMGGMSPSMMGGGGMKEAPPPPSPPPCPADGGGGL